MFLKIIWGDAERAIR